MRAPILAALPTCAPYALLYHQMPKSAPEYPEQIVPKDPANRTFAEMIDSKKASVRMIEDRLGMTYRTYLKRRQMPSDLSLAEIYRLAEWMAEPVERIAKELMSHTLKDDSVLGPGIKRHPDGIDRTKKKGQEPETEAPAEA